MPATSSAAAALSLFVLLVWCCCLASIVSMHRTAATAAYTGTARFTSRVVGRSDTLRASVRRRIGQSSAPSLHSSGVTATRRPLHTSWTPLISMTAFASHSTSLDNDCSDDDDLSSIRQQLGEISAEIAALNNGVAINPNSPAQVSAVLFNTDPSEPRPVPKEVLVNLLDDNEESNGRQRSLASLVLRYRELKALERRIVVGGVINAASRSRKQNGTKQAQQQQQHQAAAFSTSTTNKETEESSTQPTIHTKTLGRNDRSSYGRLVDSLFEPASLKQTQMDTYWHDVLDRVSKPSARSLVSQLNPYICPMGYDPFATAFDAMTQPSLPESAEPSANAGGPSTTGPTAAPTAKASTTQGKKGSLLAFVREQKERYPDCIILTRVGDFYEAFGSDAVALVEWCNLNPMASKAKAGCPIRNIQATLDGLTNAGFRVAVYEEASDTDSSTGGGASVTGGSKPRLKSRFLAQVVSSASPTYLYDLILGNGDTLVTAAMARPHVGIISTASGYTIVEVSIEERTVRVSERVTAEAVSCRLAAYPPADPLFYVPTPSEEASPTAASSSLSRLPFLPSRSDPSSDGPGSRYRVKVLSSTFLEDASRGLSDIDRARKCIVNALLKITEFTDGKTNTDDEKRITYEDFDLVEPLIDLNDGNAVHTNPLYAETANQLGLMSDPTIPPLVSYLLPVSAPAATRRFLRRWLLTPPPPHVADAMAKLVKALKDEGMSLPPLSAPPLGKVLALIRAGQSSAQVYREILTALDATVAVIEAFENSHNTDHLSSLMTLIQQESGIAAEPASVKSRCLAALRVIDEVVSSPQHSTYSNHKNDRCKPDPVTNYDDLIPFAFFERNEATWRGRVRIASAEEAYEEVRESASRLAEAIACDFWSVEYNGHSTDLSSSPEVKSPVFQDIFNNNIALKVVPSWAEDKDKYFHPRDRNNKYLKTRYTTERVDSALHDYVTSCEKASAAVAAALFQLARELCDFGHLPAIAQSSHCNLVLSTAFNHAANSNSLGWNLATLVDSQEEDERRHAGHFENIWPYWMDRSESVSNDFTLDGLFLLTAPNMSGKSTLMRSTAAAALLSACGLCAPLDSGSSIRRFDNLFVRGASADVPTESKSAFGAEMGDVAALVRACGENSLVFVDELGRGTSPKDGTSIAGAVLEAMASAGMSGFFATHLHGILKLPLEQSAKDRISYKRMIFNKDESAPAYSGLEWTYKMDDGYCTNSHALVTAAKFGLSSDILGRAEALARCVDADGNRVRETDLCDSISAAQPVNGCTEYNFADVSEIVAPHTEFPGLCEAVKILEDLTGTTADDVPPMWTPPASLEGKSCVYILEVGGHEEAPSYYVGETDALRKRITQHRKRGNDWAMLRAAVVGIEGGKSDSRNVESRLIRRMAKLGFDMVSITDGRRVRKASTSPDA